MRTLRALFRRKVPKGFQESMLFGAIAWAIPLERFPDTYNGQPLCYTAIASQKNHYALYLMCAYGDAAKRKKLEEGFRKAGKKLDMGKACLRFRSLDDLPLDVIGDTLAGVTPEKYIAIYERSRERTAPAAKGTKAKKAGKAKETRRS
jgi:hypothetical protein